MSKINNLEKQKLILAKLFFLTNKFQVMGDQIFDMEMTARQWLLTVALAQYRNYSPTLGEVAKLMGSSHQNVKQLALKLEKGGFLNIVKDKNDLRSIHLILTEKSYVFFKSRHEEIKRYITKLFEDLSKEDIDLLYDCINKLYQGLL